MNRIGRLTVVFLAICLFGALSISTAPSAAAGVSDSNRFRLIQFNMWGFHRPLQADQGYNIESPQIVIAWAGFSPDATRPLAFTLEEVCIGGFYAAASSMAQWGYSGVFLPAKNVNWDGSIHPWGPTGYGLQGWTTGTRDLTNCPQFGNAIFTRSAPASAGGQWYSWQNLPTKEYRNWLCANPSFLGTPYWVCTSHLSVDGSYNGLEFKYYQSSEYETVAQGKIGTGQTFFAGGDFNINTSSMHSWWWNNMKDADTDCTSGSSPNCEVTTIYGTKIDYLFRANPKAWSADAYLSYQYYYETSTCCASSDHKMKQGYIS